MSKCRRCGNEVNRNTTMFGYCPQCVEELGGPKVGGEEDKEE